MAYPLIILPTPKLTRDSMIHNYDLLLKHYIVRIHFLR